MRLAVVAAIASGAVALGGCQLVFGLGDYVDGVDTTGAGGSGSTSGGAGGDAATTSSGETPSSTQTTTTGAGGGGACTCVGGAWKAFEFVTNGMAGDTEPTSCGNGGELLLLHPGDPMLTCSECTCAKAGCALPAVNVYDSTNCSGSPTTLMPSGSCTTISKGSAQLAGPIGEAVCQPSGGMFQSVGFDRFVAFCGATTCDGGDDCAGPDTECMIAPGVLSDGDPCPTGFDFRTVLSADATGTCGACSCEGSCTYTPYELYAVLGCPGGGADVSPGGCTSLLLDVTAYSLKKGASTTNCTAKTGTPSVESSGARTVCCRTPIAM